MHRSCCSEFLSFFRKTFFPFIFLFYLHFPVCFAQTEISQLSSRDLAYDFLEMVIAPLVNVVNSAFVLVDKEGNRDFVGLLQEYLKLYEHEGPTFSISVGDFHKLTSYFNEKVAAVEPSKISISDPEIKIRFIGDTHGNVRALREILGEFSNSGVVNRDLSVNKKYLIIFGGDYVDRGYNSIATLVTVMLLKLISQDNVFLIRGNHESGTYNCLVQTDLLAEIEELIFAEKKDANLSRSLATRFILDDLSRSFYAMLAESITVTFQISESEKEFVLIACHATPDGDFDDIFPDFLFPENSPGYVENVTRTDNIVYSVSRIYENYANECSLILKGHDHMLPRMLHSSMGESSDSLQIKEKLEDLNKPIDAEDFTRVSDLVKVMDDLGIPNATGVVCELEYKSDRFRDYPKRFGAVNISHLENFAICVHIAGSIVVCGEEAIPYQSSSLEVACDPESKFGFSVRIVPATG